MASCEAHPGLTSTFGAVAPAADTSSYSRVVLRHDSADRSYLLHVPDATRDRPAPLLLELHGRGIGPARFDRMTGFVALANEQGFVVAMPSAIDEIWNDGRDPRRSTDDVAFLLAVIDDIRARTPIDDRRIYAVGMSNGATMIGRLACEKAERLAGVAQVAGTAACAIAASCRPARAVPIVQIHGTADRYAPESGGTRQGLRAALLIRCAGGPSVGVDEWARFWIEANHATSGPDIRYLPPDTTLRTWHGATTSSDVAFYRIEDGGDTWPGSRLPLPRIVFGRTSRTIDATRTIWEFWHLTNASPRPTRAAAPPAAPQRRPSRSLRELVETSLDALETEPRSTGSG